MAEKYIEKRLRSMKNHSHEKVVAMARQMNQFINLGGGDPDFDTPIHITNALLNAIKEGKTHYPPTYGLPALRKAIAEYHCKHGAKWLPSETIVTPGSGVSLFAAMTGTVNPGEEVVLLEPYFMTYSNLIEYCGAKEISVALDKEKGYHLDAGALNEKINKKTKMIVLCNPNNPSGTVYSNQELLKIAEIAKDNNLIVLSDEVYCEFTWDGRKHTSIASLPEMKERTIISSSFSKTFAMTGWRLGYILADEPIVKKIQKIPLGYRTNTFVQIAGVEALTGPWEPVKKMVDKYDKRRNFMVPRLNNIDGLKCHMPEGAFYLFPSFKDLGKRSEPFCTSLLKKKKILVRPGTAFGKTGEYHMRIPLIKPIEILKRIASDIENHASETT
ncbi:pyridoxal phosphate-dependent aminotransferase [Thermoproteota archaeon]